MFGTDIKMQETCLFVGLYAPGNSNTNHYNKRRFIQCTSKLAFVWKVFCPKNMILIGRQKVKIFAIFSLQNCVWELICKGNHFGS